MAEVQQLFSNPLGSQAMRDVRLVVASPSKLVIRGIVDLASTMDGVIVVASAPTPEALAAALAGCEPTVLIVDSGIMQTLRGLWRSEAPVRVLLLGIRPHLGIESSFVQQSACGYVNERDAASDIFDALEVIASCDLPQPLPGARRCEACPLRPTLKVPRLPLLDREYDVFLRIGRGQGTTLMANELGISVKTVETHRESIKRKLRLGTAHALSNAALEWRRGEIVFG